MIMLFLQDITHQQQWEALGRVFFHDMSNIIYGLVGSSELLQKRSTAENRPLVERIHRLCVRLAREVQLQKHLNKIADADYRPTMQPVRVADVFSELKATFTTHPAANERTLTFDRTHAECTFQSDFFLVLRVLTNMVVNALEATAPGGSVRVWSELEKDGIVFCTWNHQAIAESIVKRIFQRNISTKAKSGRGLGTYSMKLFGETLLGGRVDFTTSEIKGTTFRLFLPLSPAKDCRPSS